MTRIDPVRALEGFLSVREEYGREEAEELGLFREESLIDAVRTLDGLYVSGLRLFAACAEYGLAGALRALADRGFELPRDPRPDVLRVADVVNRLWYDPSMPERRRHGAVAVLAELIARAEIEWSVGGGYLEVPLAHYVAARGDAGCLELLARASPGAAHARDGESGTTPLHCAAFHLRGRVVRALIDRGADPEAEAGAGCPGGGGADALQAFLRGIDWWHEHDGEVDAEALAADHGRDLLLLFRAGCDRRCDGLRIAGEVMDLAVLHALQGMDRLRAENAALRRHRAFGLAPR